MTFPYSFVQRSRWKIADRPRIFFRGLSCNGGKINFRAICLTHATDKLAATRAILGEGP